MSDAYRCIAGQTFKFAFLVEESGTSNPKTTPTLAAADFRISINGGSLVALTNTPTNTPAGSAWVEVILAAAETTSAGVGGIIRFQSIDASGNEWKYWGCLIPVFANEQASTGDPMTLADGAITAAKIASDAITDAKVASDVTIASVTNPVTVGTNNDKTGYRLSSTGVQDIWDALTSALSTVGSVGKLLADNINTTISSRLASASYSAPPSVSAIRTEMDNNSAKLANLDEPVSSRLASASYSAPPSAATIASTVWASSVRSLTTYGSLIGDIWSYATRTLTSSGAGGATAAEVWEYATRTLSTAPPTASQIRQEMDSNSTKLANLDATVSSRATPAQVNAEVLDVLNVDTFAESSSVPAATSSLAAKIRWMFTLSRNKITQNATTQALRNDADSANIATSAISDDGTTMTRGEWS